MDDRAALFRKRALDAESKAFTAKYDETRRAWAKVARDWTLMAEREEQRVPSLNKNDPVSRPDSDGPPPSHD
jgi:hypothetical protein